MAAKESRKKAGKQELKIVPVKSAAEKKGADKKKTAEPVKKPVKKASEPVRKADKKPAVTVKKTGKKPEEMVKKIAKKTAGPEKKVTKKSVEPEKKAEKKNVEAVKKTEKKSVEAVKKTEKKAAEPVKKAEKKTAEAVKKADKKAAGAVKKTEKKAEEAVKKTEKKAEEAAKKTEKKAAEPVKKAEKKTAEPVKKAEKKAAETVKKAEKSTDKKEKKAAEKKKGNPSVSEAEPGTDGAANPEENPENSQAQFDEKLKQLLNGARKNGFVEYQEVIDTFQEFNLDEEQFDRIWDALDKNRIVLRIEQIEDDDIPEEELLEDNVELDLDMESLESGLTDGANIEDPVRMYLKEIGRVPLLSAEEEIELAKQMEAGLEAEERNEDLTQKLEKLKEQEKEAKKNKSKAKKAPDYTAKRKELEKKIAENNAAIARGKAAGKDLSQANLRLVVSIAKRYVGRGMLFLDLIQEGNLGLIKAVEKFDYRKGYKFSTYATWWIRQAITRAIADQARTIRIPVHMVETINKIIRINRQLLQELGREPAPSEIAERMDMPEERVREILKISQEPVSLETPIGEEEDSHLGDFIQDDNVPVPAEAAAFTLLREQLDEILDTLTDRERKVLTLRFGLIDGRARTLEEVGKEFSVTRERIRQIEAKALRKLRHPSRSRKIKDFLDD